MKIYSLKFLVFQFRLCERSPRSLRQCLSSVSCVHFKWKATARLPSFRKHACRKRNSVKHYAVICFAVLSERKKPSASALRVTCTMRQDNPSQRLDLDCVVFPAV